VTTTPRIAILTPLEPQQTGIASYCPALLAPLGELVSVTAVTPDAVAPLCPPIPGVEVIGLSSYLERRDSFALAVYHMGNHSFFHDWIFEQLLDRPGLVVLHDLNLTGFYSGRPEDYSIPRATNSSLGTRASLDGAQLATLGPTIEASAGVLLHSPHHVDELRRRHPTTPFFSVPLAGIRSATPDERIVRRRAWGWDEQFVFAVLGGISEFKRIDLVLHAFAAVVRQHPSVRLLIAGWAPDRAALAGLERLCRQLGITSVVRFALELSAEEFAACSDVADSLIDLRENPSGAVSSTVMNGLAAGLPIISTDRPSTFDLPSSFTTTVALDVIDAIAQAASAMRSLFASRDVDRANRVDRVELFARSSASLAAVAEGHAQAIAATLATLRTKPQRTVPARLPRWELPDRLTVIGDLTATTGLMEFGRAVTETLVTAGVGIDHTPLHCYGANHNPDADSTGLMHRLPQRRDATIELWLPNINEFPPISEDLLRPPGTQRRVIASWFWELPLVAEPYRSQLQRVDEIWTGSPFIARTLQAFTTVPVTVIPFPVSVTVPDGIERRDFGIPNDRVVFFFDFDANSTEARKNPTGLINAFELAFRGRPSESAPCLVIKVRNGAAEHHRNVITMLRERLARIDGRLIEDELTRLEMNALLHCVDVYSSMHRAEGLGLGMLEAMWLGKPVLSPAYPDKWLFSLTAAGSAVRSPLKEIESADYESGVESNGVYTLGLPWTEPEVEDAAEWMRALADDASLRNTLGYRQAQLVREHYNSRRAAEVMLERLRTHRHVGGSAGRA